MTLHFDESSSFDVFLQMVREQVDDALQRFFAHEAERAAQMSRPSLALLDGVRDMTMRGGKRMRPALLVAGHYAVAGEALSARVLAAGAAMELLQTYLLIHDDWMDRDEVRRGGKTLHRQYRELHGDAHLGASLAVLAGDLASSLALALVTRSLEGAARVRDALDAFVTMHRDVVYGQQLDLIAFEDVPLIQRLKTGSYSVKGPVLLGGLLAGGSDAQLTALERYAEPVGRILQSRDDILGTFGAPEVTGKPVGNDLRAAKRTALIAEAEQRMSDDERRALMAVFGRPDASTSEIEAVTRMIARCGALGAVEESIVRALSDASDALEGAALRADGCRRLRELAHAIAERNH